MRHRAVTLLLTTLMATVATAQPTCDVTCYDEFNGMSQRLVKAVVQSGDGMLWLATWNGLNRYDGYSFVTIKAPRSNRFNDVTLMATGDMLCRIDNRCFVFDLSTYTFTDILTPIEQRLGYHLGVRKLRPTTDGRTVMDCEDGSFITIDDSDPVATARLSPSLPRLPYRPATRLARKDIPGFSVKELLCTTYDRFGTLWVVTTDGEIWSAPEGDARRLSVNTRLHNTRLFYAATDSQGNVWLKSEQGAVKLSFGRYPGELLHQDRPAEIRCAYTDRQGRTWLAGRDDRTLRLVDSTLHTLGYIDSHGQLTSSYASFGHAVYSLCEDVAGNMWIGTKPDGLFRLTPSHSLRQFTHDKTDATTVSGNDIYDLLVDSRGRLWIATMHSPTLTRGGISRADNPTAADPTFVNSGNGLGAYPREAVLTRRMTTIGDTLLAVATTTGLVTADLRATSPSFELHTEGLPNISLVDIIEDRRGRVFIASESGGLTRWGADRGRSLLPEDVVLSVVEHGARLWAVSNNSLVSYNADDGTTATYDHNYWKRRLRFAETRPLHLGDGRWLFGLTDGAESGALIVDLDDMDAADFTPPIVLTAVSIDNHAESLSINAADTLVLQRHERSLTLRFAALDYTDATGISYAFRLDDGHWTPLGKTRSVTLLDLQPGTYRLALRSTDNAGRWMDNTRTLTIVVTPQPWETTWARLLYLLLLVAVIFATAYTLLYIRTLKRRQRDTLAAYMQLLDEHTRINERPARAAAPPPAPQQPPMGTSPADAAMMRRVMDYVETHMSTSELSIADIATAAATSPSNLNRKMRKMMNVSTADFVRQMRLQRAATLLLTTDRPISDIAFSCGFADQNYFAKCFKAKNGLTPTDYRRQNTAH